VAHKRSQAGADIGCPIRSHSRQSGGRQRAAHGIGNHPYDGERQPVAGGEIGHNVAFHIDRDCAGRSVECSLLGRSGQRLIDPGYPVHGGRAKPFPQPRGPCGIGPVELSGVHDLAADQAGSRLQVLAQPAGYAEARDGSTALCDRTLDKRGEAGCAAAASHRPHVA